VSISHEGTADPTSGVRLSFNLIRGGILDLAGGGWTATGNLHDAAGTTIVPNWFAGLSTADFHLTSSAASALGQAQPLAEVPADFDGEPRPASGPDLGADESP
jgi:hypothetical protein